MWLFLDDLADAISEGGYKKARIAACGVCALLCAGSAAFSIVQAKGQDALAAQADAKIEELQSNITDGKITRTNLENNQTAYYPVAETCEKVAALQTEYGGYSTNTAMKDIEAKTKETREKIAAYLSDGSSGSPWFNAPTIRYTWTSLNSADSTVRNVPAAWECTGPEGNIYAVCFGTYDGDLDRAGSFKVHTTRNGSLALGRPDPADEAANEDPSGVEGIIENNGEETAEGEENTENAGTAEGEGSTAQNGQSVSAGTSGYDNGYSSGYDAGYRSAQENNNNNNNNNNTVVQDKRYLDLPAGYGNNDRASVSDSSLDPADGRTPAVTETELAFAKKLDSTVRNQFYALNHAARERFMKEHPLDSNGNPTNLGQTTTNNNNNNSGSGTTVQSNQNSNAVGGTGTANMSNDDILKQIMQ